MKKILIITTVNDLSIPLFLTQNIINSIEVNFFFFHEANNELEKLLQNKYDYIYFRDPFNYKFTKENITQKLNIVINNLWTSYLIDSIDSINDIYFEDKWLQYEELHDFMPNTEILNIQNGKWKSILKKRISSRAKWIYFSLDEIPKNEDLNDYIRQDLQIVNKEFRIYALFWKVIKQASLKTSKTANSKVEITGSEDISDEIYDFAQKIVDKCKFDFVWLDIIRSWDKLYLLELNRSCLFNGYFRNNNINLAEVFLNKLLSSK